MIVRVFKSPIERPSYLPGTTDARLLAIDESAAEKMRDLMDHYKVTDDGRGFFNPPTPQEAQDALLSWIRHVGISIAELKLQDAAGKAMIAVVPPNMNRTALIRFWLAESLPPVDVLLHSLFAIGLGPHCVTGAYLLHHRAINMVRSSSDHETSTTNRPAITKNV